MRYRLLEQGPDDRSTYPECWGTARTSDGRLIAEAGTLAPLIPAALRMTHSNWVVRGPRGLLLSPAEFWARPSVAEAVPASV